MKRSLLFSAAIVFFYILILNQISNAAETAETHSTVAARSQVR